MRSYIKCDYDGDVPADVWARVQMIARLHRLRVEFVRTDRTRRGYHVVIAVRGRVALWRVVLLQAVLGSDWKREAYNSARVTSMRAIPPFWRKRLNVLYARHYRGQGL